MYVNPHLTIALLAAELYYPQYGTLELMRLMSNKRFCERLQNRIQKDIDINKNDEWDEALEAAFADSDPDEVTIDE